MATLTGKLVSDTYKALLKMIDNDILTETEKQISDGYGQGTGIFIDDNGFIRAQSYRVTGANSSQFLKGDGSLDSNTYLSLAAADALFLTQSEADGLYLPIGSTTSAIAEGSRLYFTQSRVLSTVLTGFVSTSGSVTASDSVLSAIEKLWWNIVNGGGGGGGGYIPYVGALQNVNLGEWGISAGYFGFDLTPTGTPTTAGTMSWNSQDGTADIKMGGGNVTLQVGQEELVRVVNKTGANLLEANYQAVRVSGAQGNRLKVSLAKADNDANSADTIGLVTETINDNLEGFVTAVGLVRDIDTTGDLQGETWADGEMVYLSADTAGMITNIKPQAPQHGVRMGYIVRAHKTQGQIYVKVDNGYELDELHNVLITDPVTQDILTYDETLTGGLWINRNIWTAIGATEVGKGFLSIPDADTLIPAPTKPRIARINLDNTVDAIEVGTQGYLPFYDATDFYPDSPVFTDGTDVVIGGETPNGTNKLTVIGGIWGEELVLNDQFLLATNPIGGNYSFNIYDGTSWVTQMVLSETNLVFNISGFEKMRLNSSGYLGIGTDTPTQPLHVKGVLAYPKIIIDNNSTSGGGMFSAYQNGVEIANFGVSGAWLLDSSSDVAIVATKAGQGIQFYTNGSNSEKMGINSDGNLFVGQTPTFVAGATQAIVRGKTGAGFLGVQHYDMSIKGSINTFNSVFQVGTSTFHSVAVIVEDTERARFNSGGRFLLGTTTDNTVDIFQANGSIIATAIKKTGGTSAQYLMADGSVSAGNAGTVTSVAATVPTGFAISGSPITSSGTLAITFASGYALPTTVKQSNWDDAYSWVAAFPTQTGNAGKYLTTDGSSLSWGTVTAGVSSFNTRTGAVTLLDTDVTTALGYTPYNGTTNPNGYITSSALSGYVPTSRKLSINGTEYDLTADRAWTISAGSSARNVNTFTATAGQTTFTITGGYTVNLVDVFLNGARLTGVDYTATNGTTVVLTTGARVNDIVDVVNYTDAATSGITGSGTSGYLTKWTGTSVVNSSLIYDNGTNVGIGTATTPEKLTVNGNIKINNGSADGGQLILASLGYNDWNIDNYNGSLRAYYNSSEFFRITSTGNVGIGTNVPETNSQLTLYGSTFSQLHMQNGTTGTGVNGFRILMEGNNLTMTNREAGYWAFETSDTERMRILSNGNVGIGISSPSVALDVNGAGKFSTTVTAQTGFKLPVNGNGTSPNLAYNNSIGFGINGTGIFFGNLYNSDLSTAMQFRVTNASGTDITAMTITQLGVIGIGITNPAVIGTNYGSLAISGSAGAGIRLYSGTTTRAEIYADGGALSFQGSGVPIIFYTSGEKMRVTTSGYVLIGTTDSSAGANLIIGGSSGTARVLPATDNVGYIGDSTHRWQAIYAVNGSIVTSDRNEKKNIIETDLGLNFVKKLRPVSYSWIKEDGKKHYGLIAQEIEDLGYEFGGLDVMDGKYGLSYTEFISPMIKAIQEIDYNFETQSEKIARLETRVQQLEAK